LTAGTASAAPSAKPKSAMATVAAMQPSWNLGNTLDAIPDETSWGNPLVTKPLFDTIRAQGYRSVRIPVTWNDHQSKTAPYTIDATFMSRVRQVADWALADGLYVEINVHHDSWQWIADMTTNHEGVRARFDAIWKQVAAAFKDEPPTLLFESVNEPQFNNATDAQKAQFLNELNTSFHTIVRSSGGRNGTRLLVLPTVGCTPDQKLMDDLAATIAALNDPNLVATVHFYGFWPFSVNIAGYTQFNADVQKDMTDAFARMRFAGSRVMLVTMLATLVIPFQLTMIPTFVVMRWLGLIDTLGALIVPSLVTPFAVFLMRQFFLSLPRELEEAAWIDGCSTWRVLVRIVLPLSRPALSTVAVLTFLSTWNDLTWPLIAINHDTHYTLQLGLTSFQGQHHTQWAAVMAGNLITVLPVLLAFLGAQKAFIQSVAATGLRG
ncbi:cellulase family glycosylhydrolase, partial [Kibdelosporangium lantanae]